jgi:hypothetical protein
MSFWSNFGAGIAKSPLLGGGLMGTALGAIPSVNKAMGQQDGSSNTAGPSLSTPTPPPPSPANSIGGDMARPTLFSPGAKSQIDVSSMPTNDPKFKFPSQMWTE